MHNYNAFNSTGGTNSRREAACNSDWCGEFDSSEFETLDATPFLPTGSTVYGFSCVYREPETWDYDLYVLDRKSGKFVCNNPRK